MTCARDLAVFTGAAASASRAALVRVEKPNASSTLRDRAGSSQAEAAHRSGARVQPDASRFDTGDSAPLWYGPRLRPAFVAQVLGQVFAGKQAPSSSVYRAEIIPTGLLLDERA